ncbi:hypothetical protein DL93DRAFT_2085666 [Clavulina sp. PMI_390]|nr:hypothetical protein DL93DRAFT_2085666 [Clavulina sp. PMI_390]
MDGDVADALTNASTIRQVRAFKRHLHAGSDPSSIQLLRHWSIRTPDVKRPTRTLHLMESTFEDAPIWGGWESETELIEFKDSVAINSWPFERWSVEKWDRYLASESEIFNSTAVESSQLSQE